MGKHAIWTASFPCLAKRLERGTYIRGALLPKIQLPRTKTQKISPKMA